MATDRSDERVDDERPSTVDGDLREQLAKTAAALEQERRLVGALSHLAHTIARESDLHHIVQLVTDETTALTGAQFGAFFYNVAKGGGGRYSLYTISGAPLSAFKQFPMPRATDIFRPTFEGTAVVRLDDVLADPRYGRNPPHYGMPRGHLPVRSYLAVSVFGSHGTVVGGLFFGHEEVGVFTAEHERMVTAIAGHVGTAVERAQLLAAEQDARAEAAVRADAAAALELVEDGVIMTDREGFVRLWNRGAEAITGVRSTNALARPIGEALPGWERIALDVPVGRQADNVAPATLPLDTLGRGEAWISVYAVVFGDGTVYAFRDVTDERELDVLRADVIATVSHELRTPVAAVYGAAETLRRRDLPQMTATELLEIISAEGARLAALVDEILTTSEIDSGRLIVTRRDVDVRSAIESSAKMAAVGAPDVVIHVDVGTEVSAVSADEQKLRQVLTNLIENALKYGSSDDGTEVVVRVRERGSNVRFEVRDHGAGIPQHEQGRIFEKFYRLDPHLRQGVRGTGLGLYICRELIRRMHGTIGVDSSAGAGATFWFELPRAEVAADPQPDAGDASTRD
jgi:signal transduction histidine kinase